MEANYKKNPVCLKNHNPLTVKLTVKFYRRPKNVGWLGWIETQKGKALAFIRTDGTIVPFQKNLPWWYILLCRATRMCWGPTLLQRG